MPLTASKEALALFLQGRAKIDNLEDPGTLFDQAIGKDPDFAMAYLFAGRSNQEFSRNLEKAVSLADKVSPGEREWLLAAKAQAEGDAAGRKEHLDRLVALHPKDPRTHEQVGNYYNSIGDNATALKHFTAAAKLDKRYAPAYNNIGYMNMPLGRYADAERAFKAYIKLTPKNPNPYDSYAELLMKTGKYDESIRQYNRALAVDPMFFNSYRGIGNNYEYKGDYAKARESYRRMFDGAPDDAGRGLALVSEMNSYVAEGKTAEALAANERRREMAEKAGDVQTLIGVHTAAGLILVEAGKLDAAALQGVGGGLLIPVGMATLFREFPEDERAKASAIFSVPAAVAPALGPLVGGLLIDTAGWRWISLINVPIGIIGFVLGILWLREYRISDAGSLDRKGFVLSAVAIVALTYALSVVPDGPMLRASVLVPLLVGCLTRERYDLSQRLMRMWIHNGAVLVPLLTQRQV